MPLAGDTKFAGYTILRLLGSGGMGEVYLARHPRLPREDALKVLRADISADRDYRERFNREADLAAKLWHPHIVGVHDRGEYDHLLWISMDYVEGTDASRLLHRYPRGMPLADVVEIVTAVAGALDYAHARGLLHRDVKPANILVAESNGDERRVLLSDFGVARELAETSSLTVTNMTVGTMAYAAPEQLMGQPLDGRADQYALAATAFHLLNGAPLFPYSNPAVVISQHLNAPPPKLSLHHPELAPADAVLARGLTKAPGDRFASCMDFARALSDSTQMPTATYPTYATYQSAAPPPSRRHWAWILPAAALLVVLCVGAYLGIRLFHKPAASEAFALVGTVHLRGDSITTSGLPSGYRCAGAQAFDDIAPGAPVTVADESGKILAKGAIESSYGQPGVCNLRFTVEEVPADAKFYRVRVGQQSENTYIEAEARAGIEISLGSQEPATSSTSTVPRTTTSTPTTTPPRADPESAALHRLQSIAADDRSTALAYVNDQWVPQVSSKYEGLQAEGITWDYQAILNEHLQIRQRWGDSPGVLLLWSPDWSTFDNNRGYWVTVVGRYSPDYRPALAWCNEQGLDVPDHCFAKLISTTHPVEDSTRFK